jgi:dTDP-4-dehydrorhamnose reductase
LLITGATGTLGRAMAAACSLRGIPVVLTGRQELDLHDHTSIARALDGAQPWAVVNTAGWVRVDDAEDQAAACLAANRDGAVALARACADCGSPTLSFSSDLVFGPGGSEPRGESAPTAPLSIYGRSKAEMEARVQDLPGTHLIARTAAFFSPFDEANFAVHAVRALRRGEAFRAAEDYHVTPSYLPHLCDAALDLLIDGETGLWHLTNAEQVTWAEFGRRVAVAAGLDPALIEAVPGATLGWRAQRPRACGLVSERGNLLPSLDRALDDFVRHLAPAFAPA